MAFIVVYFVRRYNFYINLNEKRKSYANSCQSVFLEKSKQTLD
jgi:hypothetical protein